MVDYMYQDGSRVKEDMIANSLEECRALLNEGFAYRVLCKGVKTKKEQWVTSVFGAECFYLFRDKE